MDYEKAWVLLNEMIVKNEMYGSNNDELQYILGFIDGIN